MKERREENLRERGQHEQPLRYKIAWRVGRQHSHLLFLQQSAGGASPFCSPMMTQSTQCAPFNSQGICVPICVRFLIH